MRTCWEISTGAGNSMHKAVKYRHDGFHPLDKVANTVMVTSNECSQYMHTFLMIHIQGNVVRGGRASPILIHAIASPVGRILPSFWGGEWSSDDHATWSCDDHNWAADRLVLRQMVAEPSQWSHNYLETGWHLSASTENHTAHTFPPVSEGLRDRWGGWAFAAIAKSLYRRD